MAKKSPEASKAAPRNSEFNPFLRAADIGPVGTRETLALTGFNHTKPNGTFGPEIVMEVRLPDNEKYYDFSIREGSPNHRRLFRAYGPEIKNWRGGVNVEIQQSNNSRAFIAVIDGEKAPF